MPFYHGLFGRHGLGVENTRPIIALIALIALIAVIALATMAHLKQRQPNKLAELSFDG